MTLDRQDLHGLAAGVVTGCAAVFIGKFVRSW